MQLTLLVFETCLMGLAASSPASLFAREPQGHPWIPSLPGQSRSPCPGLNVMANHGFLPRSGKNISLADVRSGVAKAYNYEPTTFDSAFQMAVDLKVTTTGNPSTFNLADLAAHDKIEFDGSLSRNDHFFGDDNDFSPLVWATTAKRLGLYDVQKTKKDKYVTVETAAKARAGRVADAKKFNPQFNASTNQITGSPGTTALYLATLWDQDADAAPKSWIRAFFEQERIPYLEGYASSLATQKDGNTIGVMFQRVQAVMTKRQEETSAPAAHWH